MWALGMGISNMLVKRRSGFSLIELLVVIAIIGILSSVGVVGYNDYITRSKEQATLADFNQLERIVQTDGIALRESMGVNSAFTSGLSAASLCEDWRDQIISQINATKKNPFDNSTVIVDGNNCGAGAAQCQLESDGTKSWKRGQFLLYCADECAPLSSSLRLKACACRTSETCSSTVEIGDDKCTTPPDGRTC